MKKTCLPARSAGGPSGKIFITTAIDYTNDVVHVGHAYQKILADCLARYYRLEKGDKNVFFLTGTDEHGGNIEESAQKKRKSPKEFVDEIVGEDKKQWKGLNISYDRFIRTTDEDHKKTVEEFWKKSLLAGDIYKGTFQGLYCLGCESYKTTSEIVDEKCPLHVTKTLQKEEEENYFFRWSKYQSFLEDFFKKRSHFVIPHSSQHEMESFLASPGIADIPISRPKEKLSWGIMVPDDSTQVIYVWFDALINYYTGAIKKGFWPVSPSALRGGNDDTIIIHIIGKDILRWHALLWTTMLKSVGLRLPDRIYSHGFINLNGQKISKSLGNVIRPSELVDQFGTDAVRYFFLKYGPLTDDIDISIDRIKEVYNSELADGLGNTISRLAKLCETSGFITFKIEISSSVTSSVADRIKDFHFHDALEIIKVAINLVNKSIDDKKPWNLRGDELYRFLQIQVNHILQIAIDLAPFMPETSEKIIAQFIQIKIKAQKPYFPKM